jgi:hypothetical protein
LSSIGVGQHCQNRHRRDQSTHGPILPDFDAWQPLSVPLVPSSRADCSPIAIHSSTTPPCRRFRPRYAV